jgi:SAM-dependent methyltransferase
LRVRLWFDRSFAIRHHQTRAMASEVVHPDLQGWFETPLGAYLLAHEQQYFDLEVADVFGFNAFQLGLSRFDFLRANRMPLQCRLSTMGEAASEHGTRMLADPHALPILGASADLVLLPHVLEFSDNPHQVLREVARILMPEGHVIVSGFNPWSFWGARQLFERNPEGYPWRGQFINLPRLKDWMALLGLEITGGRMCCYIPPATQPHWIERLSFLDAVGDRWWPFGGGVYFLHAVKRVQGMRVITPQWKRRVVKSKALAPVPHRVHDGEERLVARTAQRSTTRK